MEKFRLKSFVYSILLSSTIVLSLSVKAQSLKSHSVQVHKSLQKNTLQLKTDDSLISKNIINLTDSVSVSRKTSELKHREKKSTTEAKKINNSKRSVSGNTLFSIYDAWISLDKDYDGDGYYSEFSLNVDADYAGALANVFMDIYISQDGENWDYFDSSDIFTIQSDEEDTYTLGFELNHSYPTDSYSFLIQLYQQGSDIAVAQVDQTNFTGLYEKTLEDKEYELTSLTQITYVASSLSLDYDYDNYFTRLILEYDIATNEPSRSVYARVVLTDRFNQEISSVDTASFILGTQTEVIEIDFDYGYSPSDYDIQIQLVDVMTNQIIAHTADDFTSLNKLSIESVDYDDYNDSGSLGIIIGWLLLTLLIIRLLSDKKDNQ
jgi:hypothetical protein